MSQTPHYELGHIMQSVFSVALPQEELECAPGRAGDAALKMCWTKPLTASDAMGIDSSVPSP